MPSMMETIPRSGFTKWTDAELHLAACDERLATIIARVGPCTLSPRRDYFAALCQSVMGQQISTVAAAAIYGRFVQLFPRAKPDPRVMLGLDVDVVRAAGVGHQKITFLRDIASGFVDGRVQPKDFAGLNDETLIAHLVQLKGVGRWTAEMFLMFAMNRPDVLPVDDLGFRAAALRVYGLRKLPSPDRLGALAKKWRPYRTIATWYLWRSK